MRIAAALLFGLLALPLHAAGQTTFTVLSAGDADDFDPDDGVCDSDGGAPVVCTFRAAVQQANATPGADLIHFAIGGGPISISTRGVIVTDPLTIDGTTQPDWVDVPIVELNGAGVSASSGIRIVTDNTTIRGLIINRFDSDGIEIEGRDNVIVGNYIGTNASGTLPAGNEDHGVFIDGVISGFANNNLIGGELPADRNVISGNGGSGVVVSGGSFNVVIGNFIGTDVSGTDDIPNFEFGVHVLDSNDSRIGGVEGTTADRCTGECNLISASGKSGVLIQGGVLTGNRVLGNFIGTEVSGTQAVSNESHGVQISNSTGNTVGSVMFEGRNVISGNDKSGVSIDRFSSGNVVWGNAIGVDAGEEMGVPNGDDGVRVDGTLNIVGGEADGAGNIIAGNLEHGIQLFGADGNFNEVTGNLIGAVPGDLEDLDPVGNGGSGVHIRGASDNLISDNTVLENTDYGVEMVFGATGNLVVGNLVGIFDTSAMPNQMGGVLIDASPSNVIRDNLISGNNGDGLTISDQAATGNLVQDNQIGVDGFGNAAANLGSGVFIEGGSNNQIGTGPAGPASSSSASFPQPGGNVISGNADHGVEITFSVATENRVSGNFIGTNESGDGAVPNGLSGVFIGGFAHDNIVGGLSAEARNVISGNLDHGVVIDFFSNENTVLGNYVGTNALGDMALPNGGGGVLISEGSERNQIGGEEPGARNVISGNQEDGVWIDAADENDVLGNYIGTKASGNEDLPNGASGVAISGGVENEIGSLDPIGRNVISGNTEHGVVLQGASELNEVHGNYIGLGSDGLEDLGNTGAGVYVTEQSNQNQIGGQGILFGPNVISGNVGPGVAVDGQSTSTSIVGNVIGTSASGEVARPNVESGVALYDARLTMIGGIGAGEGNTISANMGPGIQILDGSTGTLVQGNTISENLADDIDNPDAHGVVIENSSENTIGGSQPGAENRIFLNFGHGILVRGVLGTTERNVIQGNQIGLENGLVNVLDGIHVASADQTVIGTNLGAGGNRVLGNGVVGIRLTREPGFAGSSGTTVLGNSVAGSLVGILVEAASSTTIGGLALGEGNQIYDNGDGIAVWELAEDTELLGNYVGLAPLIGDVPPNSRDGISVAAGATGTLIGGIEGTIAGLCAGACNLIALNEEAGVRSLAPVTLRANSILLNGGLGFDRGPEGVTPNDGSEQDGIQNRPTINAAVAGSLSLQVQLTSFPNTEFLFDFYSGLQCDPSGTGEGADHLGAAVRMTSGTGTIQFDVTLDVDVVLGEVITATATGPIGTSEFSECRTVTDVAPVATRVNTTDDADDGSCSLTHCSLREAINAANTQAGTDVISFDIPGAGPHTIQPGSALPTLTDPTRVDGTTEPDYAGTPVVVLDGSSAGAGVNGLRISTDRSVVTGLEIRGFSGDGVEMTSGTTNTVRLNSIHSNGALGIDLGADGVSDNDVGDADNGVNGLQNFPVVTSVRQGSTIIAGSINSTPSTELILDFYSNTSCGPLGYGQGRTHLEELTVTTDGSGDADFSVTHASTVPVGTVITATATDPTGSTSEFSQCVTLADFAVALSPASVTVNAQAAATFTVAVDPVGGAFTEPVVLTCPGAPAGLVCSFSPATVTPGQNGTTSVLRVTAQTAASGLGGGLVGLPRFRPLGSGQIPSPWSAGGARTLLLLGTLLIGLALVTTLRGRPGVKLRVPVILALLALAAACSGGEPTGPPPPDETRTFNFTVTGTSGGVERSATGRVVVRL